jgi:predicted membrane GTPase involved in stress response
MHAPPLQETLEAIVERVPPPRNTIDSPLRALIFDSYYDAYRGVVCQFRVMDGAVSGKQEQPKWGGRGGQETSVLCATCCAQWLSSGCMLFTPCCARCQGGTP